MKKLLKIISFSLVILLALPGLSSNISAASGNGEILRELGILKGDMNGDLLLDQPLKRQDAVVLLSRLLGEEDTAENYPGKPSFTDIADPYYVPFIAWAEDSGLTEGVGNGLFGYDDFLTNQQLMAFLLRALGYEFYGDEYGLVPGKAYDLELSPPGEEWGKTTTRQTMADRTVTLLRIGRIKASNVTLERSLAMQGTSLPDNGQLFQLLEAEVRNGLLVASFRAPAAQDYNSSRSNTTAIILNEGPDVNDIRVTVEKDENGIPMVLDLDKQFYDSTTGVLLASFEQPDVPDGSTVEIRINYLEDREIIAHEAAHVIQQKSPGTYEPGELLLLLEEILGDFLQTGTGNLSGEEFNDDNLDQLAGLSENPLYEENSNSSVNPLYESETGISGGSGEISLYENVSAFVPENLFTIILHDGDEIDCTDCVSAELTDRTVSIVLDGLDIEKSGKLEIILAYTNTGNLPEQYAFKYGLDAEAAGSIISDLILSLQKASKPDNISSTYNFGLLTIHEEEIDLDTSGLMTLNAVIVGTERTMPELDDEVLVALLSDTGEPELRKYSYFDYGNSFRSDDDAYEYFSRYLDPDDDGDGISDLVYLRDKKPVRVIKRIDKASPLLMAPDGGLGDHVTLFLDNGRIMFWSDGMDNDCDDTDRDVFPTETYIDSIETDLDSKTLRTGRNPQTGKEIKIAGNTTIVIDHADGSVTTSTLSDPDGLLKEQSSFPYARVVADKDGNALFIHIVEDAVVVYIEAGELDKSTPRIIYTNTDDLTEEEINFLLSDEHEIDKFIYRQEFGQVSGSSERIYNKRKFAEIIDYTTDEKSSTGGPRFRPGADLGNKVNAAGGGEDNDCDLILVGDPPVLDGKVDFSEVPEGTEALMVVDSFFDIFTELSTEFRGHVTVLK